MSNNSILIIERTLSVANTPGQSGLGSNGQWWVTRHSTKLQDWNLAIRLFNVISRTLIECGGLTPLHRCSWCILQLQPTGLCFCRGNCDVNYNPLTIEPMKDGQHFCEKDTNILVFRCIHEISFIVQACKKNPKISLLHPIMKAYKGGWKNWKLEDNPRPSKQLYC